MQQPNTKNRKQFKANNVYQQPVIQNLTVRNQSDYNISGYKGVGPGVNTLTNTDTKAAPATPKEEKVVQQPAPAQNQASDPNLFSNSNLGIDTQTPLDLASKQATQNDKDAQADKAAKRKQTAGNIAGAAAGVIGMAGGMVAQKEESDNPAYGRSVHSQGAAGAGKGAQMGASAGAAFGPWGALIGAGVGAAAGGTVGALQGVKNFNKNQEAGAKADQQNQSLNAKYRETQKMNFSKKKGYSLNNNMYRKGTKLIEVEKDELILRKDSKGKYKIAHDMIGQPTHEEGGVKVVAQEGDAVTPGNQRDKALKALSKGTKEIKKVIDKLPADKPEKASNGGKYKEGSKNLELMKSYKIPTYGGGTKSAKTKGKTKTPIPYSADVEAEQKRLQLKGLYKGKIDGRAGDLTKQARLREGEYDYNQKLNSGLDFIKATPDLNEGIEDVGGPSPRNNTPDPSAIGTQKEEELRFGPPTVKDSKNLKKEYRGKTTSEKPYSLGKVGNAIADATPGLYNLGRGLFDPAVKAEREYFDPKLKSSSMDISQGIKDIDQATSSMNYSLGRTTGGNAGVAANNQAINKLRGADAKQRLRAEKYNYDQQINNANVDTVNAARQYNMQLKQGYNDYDLQGKAIKGQFVSQGLTDLSTLNQSRRNTEIQNQQQKDFNDRYLTAISQGRNFDMNQTGKVDYDPTTNGYNYDAQSGIYTHPTSGKKLKKNDMGKLEEYKE